MKKLDLTREEWLDAAEYAYPTGGNSVDGNEWVGIGIARDVDVLLIEHVSGTKSAWVINNDNDHAVALELVDALDAAYYGDDNNWEG